MFYFLKVEFNLKNSNYQIKQLTYNKLLNEATEHFNEHLKFRFSKAL